MSIGTGEEVLLNKFEPIFKSKLMFGNLFSSTAMARSIQPDSYSFHNPVFPKYKTLKELSHHRR